MLEMLKKTVVILALLAIVFSAFMVSGTPTRAQNKPLKIALSLPDLAFPFFVNMVKQVQDEATKLGDVTIIVMDGQGKTDKQTADLESVIAQKYDGLLVSPITVDAMQPAVQEVVDAKIPVVTIDRNVSNVKTLAHVGADNVKGGELQGELIMKMFPNGAKIFNLQGTPGASPAIDRNKGLHNVLDPVKDKYKIIFEQTANFNRDNGLSVTEAGLNANDVPDVISCANDDMALGAIEALKAKNLVGKVAVIGFDALPEALLAIKNGQQTGTVEQFPGGQSRTALDLIVDYLRNNKSPEKHDNYLTPAMITKDNLNDAERIAEIEAPATMAATMAPTMAATK
jgi:ABC-type sugar transport system substrate-binding protein